MINDFGIKSSTSKEDIDFFSKLKVKLEEFDIVGSLYYGYPLYEQDKQRITLRSILNCKLGVFVFFRKEEEKKSYQRYITDILMGSEELSELYFNNQLVPVYLKIEEIDIEQFVQKLSQEREYDSDIMALFDQSFQKCFGLNHSDERDIKKQGSIGSIIKKRNNSINSYDEIQFKSLYEDAYTNARIRGLAGSGKTILLVKKMAYMHFKMRNLKLVYVFYTKSLKQYITNMFVNFYHDFDRFNDPDWNNVKIVHGWGSQAEEGFYSLCCKNCNVVPERYSSISSLEEVCFKILENCDKSLLPVFDYIFIDEAQDFRINFFKLAKCSLKSTGKLIYAYDELQTLDSSENKMPQKEDIFDSNEECKDIGLSRCYRTPLEILVVAHAIGLGIYRVNKSGKREFSSFISDKSLWTDIGYKIRSGKLVEGEEVTLYRENIIEEKVSDMIDIRETKNLEEEFNIVIQEINNLIFNEDVRPEDILIIDLDSVNLQDNYRSFRGELYSYFEEQGLIQDKSRPFGINLVYKQNALNFVVNNNISYTTIFRAKGNEAPIVFIINAHKMGVLERYRRNRLFTAMTRAKTKVYLLGDNNMDAIISEYQHVKENNYMLTFTYPTQDELNFYRDKMLEESKQVQGLQDSIDFAKKLTKEQLIRLLLEQTGQGSTEELIKYIQDEDKDTD